MTGRNFDHDTIALVREVLSRASSVFSIAHPFSDGDALGSQLAMHHFCKSRGKRSLCLNFDPLPAQISWLAGVDQLSPSLPDDEIFDVAFLMETTEISRMGERAALFNKAKIRIHIDHHRGIPGLGDINLLDENASSTCEILYDLLAGYGFTLDKNIFEPLYVGILTDTGNFRHSNTTRRSHEIAGMLIDAGLDVPKIHKLVYENSSFNRVRIHGVAMSRTASEFAGKTVYSWLTLDDFNKIGASEIDADGFISHLCAITGVEVALFFRETVDGNIKVSFRSTGKVDIQSVCKLFGGGGHKLAAGTVIPGSLNPTIKEVLAAVEPVVADLS